MKRKLTLSILLISIFAIIMQPMVYAETIGERVEQGAAEMKDKATDIVDGLGEAADNFDESVTDAFIGLLEDIKGDTTIDTDVEIGKTDQILYSKKATERMFGIVQVIGSLISVIALSIIGIRYMLSSVEEQAKMKGVIGYYITGAVLVFATSNVLSIAYNIIRSLE